MSRLFEDSKFNGDISQWDVSNVTNMEYMFKGSKFNGDISQWDVSSDTNISGMFDDSDFEGAYWSSSKKSKRSKMHSRWFGYFMDVIIIIFLAALWWWAPWPIAALLPYLLLNVSFTDFSSSFNVYSGIQSAIYIAALWWIVPWNILWPALLLLFTVGLYKKFKER